MSEGRMTGERTGVNSVLLAAYMWMFMLLRVLWAAESRYSTAVLAAAAVVIVLRSMSSTRGRLGPSFGPALVLLGAVMVSLIIDSIFRANGVLLTRAYNYLVYGVIPVLLLSQVRDIEAFLRSYAVLSAVVFVVYVLDPFMGYRLTQGYMVYGFQAMLPAFYGLYIGYKRYRWRWAIIGSAVAFVMLTVFGNRMAGLAALLFLVGYEVAFGQSNRNRPIRVIAFTATGAVIVANLGTILSSVSQLLDRSGYYSYSLSALLLYFGGMTESLISGREALWSAAIELIRARPVLGYGLGYFDSLYGMYPHNIVFELLVSYGVIGLTIYAAGLVRSLVEISKSEGSLRLLGLLLLCTSFPKLLTSVHLFIEPSFWMLIFYGFFAPAYRRQARGIEVQSAQ